MKVLIIGDLHLGIKNDSRKHNQQILDFIDYVCQEHSDVDKVVQLGDWFDNRTKISLNTLDMGIQAAKKLSKAFGGENVDTILGNHDIFHKDTLRPFSPVVIEPYINVIDEPTTVGDMFLVPWIITEDDWKTCVAGAKDHKYLMAHLELNGFLMNANYAMEGGQSPKELRDYGTVFTGHFHGYQKQGNIIYTGTPIPMSQNEANRDMGYMTLDTETGEHEFHVYNKVQVLSISYDKLEETLETVDPENTSIRVEFPDDLKDETIITDVVDTLNEMNFSDVKTKYTGNKASKLLEAEVDTMEEVENIDSVVLNFIDQSTEVEGIDPSLLKSIYNEAREMQSS